MAKNRAPVAILSEPVIDGNTVRVDGSASYDPDGNLRKWKISWGDGEEESGNGAPGIAEHTYGEAGVFDIVLLVQDNRKTTASTTVAVTIADVPPVDCVLSEWSAWVPTSEWSECVDGSQSRTEQRTRTVVTPPSGGGAACGPLTEDRTVTQACVVPVDCVLSEWSAWAPKADASGQWTPCVGGSQSRVEERTRTIVTEPANGGAACGPLVETRTVTQPCSPSGGKAVITPADLVFKGFYRIDRYYLGYWSRGCFASRVVNGERRFFVLGDETEGDELIEVSLPSAAPNHDLASAPTMLKVKSWGKPFTRQNTGAGNNSSWLGGMHWDDQRNAILYSYGEGYIPTGHDPSIGAVVLNDTTGSTETFGNWRTRWNSQKTRGAFCDIPQAFADAHLGGARIGISSSQTSGNFHSPFGACLSAFPSFDPRSVPPDPALDRNDVSIENKGIILHDYEHRQSRDTRFKTCGWVVQYDCRQGSFIRPGTPVFGGDDPAAGQDDTMNSCVWVDLPDKHGLVFFGTLVTTPQGYTAPGDPDGLVHLWYGDPFRSDGSAAKTCCHGQDDPWWFGTGPGAHYRVPMGWIYNPDDLKATIAGTTPLYGVRPSSDQFEWRSINPQLPARDTAGAYGGAYFEPSTRRIYVLMTRHDRVSHPPHGRPCVAVYEVA
jgi:hypothetical protein